MKLVAVGPSWSSRITKISTSVEQGRKQTLTKAGLAAKDEHNKVIRRDSGGDMRLSGVGRSKGRGGNTKVGARFDIKGDTVEVRATGPLHIIAYDTEQHGVASAYIRGSRQVRSQYAAERPELLRHTERTVIKIPGVGYRRWARHPGTRGKDTWRKGFPAARRAAAREIHDVHTNIVRKALG